MGRAFRAALALFLCLFSAAASFAASPAAMPIGRPTTTPIGWIMFCEANNGECRPGRDASPGPHPSTPDFLQLVETLNDRVNGSVKPMTDRALYGVEERWTYPNGRGDCEDFALEKRRELNRAGVPLSDLLITVVRKRDGEGHAILTVRTTDGDYVLDNLTPRMKRWDETSYTFVKRQSSADPNVWLTIVNDADVAVGALQR